MNARTVKRLVMRNRRNSFFGRRAYVTLCVDKRAMTTPRPENPFTADGWKELGVSNLYEKDGESYIIHLGSISSLTKPDESEEGIYFLTEAEYGGYEWWVGEKVVDRTVVGHLPEELVGRYKAWSEWEKEYVHGFGRHDLSEANERLINTGLWAKTHYYEEPLELPDKCLFIYSVKWFYPHRRKRFSSDLAHTVTWLNKNGYRARVWKKTRFA